MVEAPALLVAGDFGVAHLDSGLQIVPPADGRTWVEAIPDGRGGTIHASVAAGSTESDQEIWWTPAAGPPLLVSNAPGRQLHDVAVIEQRPHAVVVDRLDDLAGSEVARLLDVEAGSQIDIGVVAARPQSVAHLRYANNRIYFATYAAAGCGKLGSMGLDGAMEDLSASIPIECNPWPVTGLALAADGQTILVLETSGVDSHGLGVLQTALGVYRKDSGSVSFPIGQPGDRLEDLDYAENHAIVGRRLLAADLTYGEALMIAVDSGATTDVATDGAFSVRFLE